MRLRYPARRGRRHGRAGNGRRVTGAIAAVAAIGVALSGCEFRGVYSLPLPGGVDTGDDSYTVQVQFANVLDLVPQSLVKVNDVSAGKVTKVELDGWHAVVTCEMKKDVKLPDNAVATISQTSLLGEKFVALSPPSNEQPRGELAGGDEIGLARTTRGSEVEEVLSALSMLINGGGVEQLSTITRELNAAMSGREDKINSVLHRIDTFAGTLDRHKHEITRAIDKIDALTKKLNKEKKTITETIDKAGPAVKQLAAQRADLTKMLVSLSDLSDTAVRVVNKSSDDLKANLKSLQPVLKNLNETGDTLPETFEMLLTFPFPPTIENALRGDYGNVDVTLDLDANNLLQNFTGGTPLEGASKLSNGLRDQLFPPRQSLETGPLGVLPKRKDGAGESGPGESGQGGGQGPPATKEPSGPSPTPGGGGILPPLSSGASRGAGQASLDALILGRLT